MKLFHSTKKDNQKDLHVSSNVLRGLGHTPMADWIALLLVSMLIIVGIAFYATVHYMKAITFIKELPSQDSNTDAAQIKTKEERLQDVVEIYTKKQQAHLELLGVTKSTVAKDTVSASTTKATSTSTNTELSTSTVPTPTN